VFSRAWPAMPNNIGRARRALLEHLAPSGLSEPRRDAIAAAVTEVMTNSVYHAFVGRRIGQFRTTVEISDGEIVVTIDDDGGGFDAGSPPSRGLLLVEALADRVETASHADAGTHTAIWFAPR
jgi:two-component sensor histidine kinase